MNRESINRQDSSTRELESITQELAAVEEGLEVTRRGNGRAAFNSIQDALGSIRSRLHRVAQHEQQQPSSPPPHEPSLSGPSTTTTRTSRTTGTSSTTSSNSIRSSLQSLSHRLRTADMSLSTRIPLGMLRGSQEEVSQRRQDSRANLMARSTGSTKLSTRQVADKDQETVSEPLQLEQQPPPPREYSLERSRSTSTLVASRVRADQAEDFQVDVASHANSEKFLEAVTETSEHSDVTTTSDDRKSMLSEDSQNESLEPPTTTTTTTIITATADNDDESGVEVVVAPETPILLTQSQQLLGMASAALSGTLCFLPPDTPTVGSVVASSSPTVSSVASGSIVYSWGSGIQSLHDDGDDKTVQQARVGTDARISQKSVLSVATSESHTACATIHGKLLICGRNTDGCVDPDRREEEIVKRPALLESLGHMQIVQVSCGLDHTAALSSNGSLMTWGSNAEGQLGHRLPVGGREPSTSFCRPQGLMLTGGRRAAAVACGHQFTLVLTTRMSVLACGVAAISGYSKNHGNRLASPLPALEGLPLVAVAAGDRHAVVLTAHGTAFTWGDNATGCCGRPYPESLSVPVPIHTPKTANTVPYGSPTPFPNWAAWGNSDGAVSLADDVAIVHAACGNGHTVLVTRSGRLLVCGRNDCGQIGSGGIGSNVTAVASVEHPEVSAGKCFVTAEVGDGHTLLLDNDGDVWQMGSDGPEQVMVGKQILTIAAGGKESIAVAAGRGSLQRSFSISAGSMEVDGDGLVHSLESLIETISDEDKENHALSPCGQELANRTEELLKYPSVLNSLFLNPAELDHMYNQLVSAGNVKVQQAVATAIEKGIKFGLESIRSDNSRMIYPEAIRCLLLYIKFFDREEDSNIAFDSSGDCILAFCEAILNVPFEGYKALFTWATTIYRHGLFTKMLVHPLLAQLDKALKIVVDKDGVEHRQKSRRAAPVIVAVLTWLHKASEHKGLNVAPEDFYSKGVSSIAVESLYEDLERLKNSSKHEKSLHFFLCSSPFLLTPECKRNLLEIQNQVEMYKVITSNPEINDEDGTYSINPFFTLEIERAHLLDQTLEKIKNTDEIELRKKLRVIFKGEEGIDAGGVTKEFFQLLSEDLFDINSGLWSKKYGDGINWFNSECTWDEKGFELVGVLVGLALYNAVLLDVHFPVAVYRKILGFSLGLEDLVDEELKKGLQQLLDYEGDDAEYVFCLNFEVTWTNLGQEQKIELKPGGSDIAVTSDNREEYVILYVKWVLVDSIQPQWDAFEKGFDLVMKSSSLDLFRPEELELLVVGTPDLDFGALEENTKYEGGYEKDSPVIRNFWKFVQEADTATQINFLKFATASTKAPIGGLGRMDFKIQRAGPDSHQLPTSHTCFNTLLIPDYGSDYNKLSERLGRAIVECEGFGLQ